MKIDSYLIAKMAGVSQATVSRAFSNPDKVSAKTRNKILEVADSIGYKPDKNASALRRKGTNTILLIYVKREDGHYWTNVKRNYWLFTEAILSLTSFFENQPYIFEVKLVNSIFSMKKAEIKDHCDGMLIFDHVSEEESKFIDDWDIPYVICHRSIHLNKYNHSATDNRAGGVIQGNYLKSKSCKKPIYILNNEDQFSHNLRKQGFLEIFPEAVVLNEENPQEIVNKLILHIESGDFDGVGFVNDMLLVKIVTKLFHNRYELQDEFPLIGYDNSTELLVLDKKPATVEIGIKEIYENAASELLKLIKKEITNISLVHSPILVE
ncbi:MAG: LacI family transcriptional regulator [Spirochaetaceae bacterium]